MVPDPAPMGPKRRATPALAPGNRAFLAKRYPILLPHAKLERVKPFISVT
jgi:hypothetical protein